MAEFIGRVAHQYDRLVVDTGKQPEMLIFTSFILTFLSVRAVTHSIRAGRLRLLRDIRRAGVHIHHLVWGIFLLLLTGYLALAFDAPRTRAPLAVLFGMGAALTLDEFALWLNLEDVYWTAKGRRSIDVMIITSAILGLVLVGFHFWVNLGREAGRLLGLA